MKLKVWLIIFALILPGAYASGEIAGPDVEPPPAQEATEGSEVPDAPTPKLSVEIPLNDFASKGVTGSLRAARTKENPYVKRQVGNHVTRYSTKGRISCQAEGSGGGCVVSPSQIEFTQLRGSLVTKAIATAEHSGNRNVRATPGARITEYVIEDAEIICDERKLDKSTKCTIVPINE